VTLPGFDAAPVGPKLSYGRRLTLRHEALLARGVHPLNQLALAANGYTCGDCVHAFNTEGYTRKCYWKCDLRPVNHSAASDLRLSWPACVGFEAGRSCNPEVQR